MAGNDCLLCRAADAEEQLNRTVVWEDDLWRLSMSRRGFTLGFGYLEPKRHVPHITDLDGDEAATFGPVLARVTRALEGAADAELVYVYIFGGGIPHLHVHLGPHRDGDPLNDHIIRGEVTYEPQPSGAMRIVSHEFLELPTEEIEGVIERARRALAREMQTSHDKSEERARPQQR
jgi:diadenosine tetraphosphate (Ap4A) HIT family hydrolase